MSKKLKIAKDLFDLLYPIGTYYETSNANWTPSSAGWYGTWVEDTSGKTLVARDSGTFKTLNANVGSETSTHKHPLSSAGGANIRKYGNVFIQGECTTAGTMPPKSDGNCWWCTDGNADYAITTNPDVTGIGIGLYGNTDNGNSSTIQPSVVVRRWHRTA